MRKVFIDCGGHRGQSIGWAKAYTDCNEFHSFEPNSELWRNFDTNLHKEAVWIYDGEVDFFVAEKVGGSTIVQGKKTANVDYDHPVRVPCIDLGKWIKNTFNKEDYIILKLNIEGAEYEVLRSMVNDGSIEYIDKLYAELHYKKLANFVGDEDDIVALVEPYVKIRNWNAKKLYK